MSAHEVTVAQYRRFVVATGHPAGMPKTGFKQGDDHPIAGVTWNDAAAFCEWVSGEEGRSIRLPTEAEWEYACRARTETPWNLGADDSTADDFGWYAANADKRTHPVGSKQPNAFGLFDMHGNAREWCADWYAQDYAFPGTGLDSAGPATAETKVLRGGWYDENTWVARSSHRNGDFKPGWSYPGLGFRLVNELTQSESHEKR
jgi:formylglycine-generating enzyme required for sulfatase activity